MFWSGKGSGCRIDDAVRWMVCTGDRCRAGNRRLPGASPILTADPKNVGDLFLGNGLGARVAELFVDGEFFLDSDAKRLVELAASLKDVCDSARGDSEPPAVIQVGECVSCLQIGGFRLCHFSERPLQVPSSIDRSESIGRHEERAARYCFNSSIRARRRGARAVAWSTRVWRRSRRSASTGSVKSNTPERHAQRSAARIATLRRFRDRTQTSRGRAHRSASAPLR